MGNIKTTRYDVGAEVLSILTRGMYPDPKDTLREYIQNGVDAGAKSVQVRIRRNTITIDDDGKGMDVKTIRKAARVGVSDKNPGKDVGFMGIGIYSSFHLCDTLTIYSRKQDDLPCFLCMDFKGMREVLDDQKEKRLNQGLESSELIDLQSLLERNIIVDETTEEDFPTFGTRVEIEGLSSEFLSEFLDFNIMSKYLKEVVPLEFDRLNFKWADIIEHEISKVCNEHDSKFELIKLLLQVNNQKEWLFRSYKDSDFNDNTSYEPKFYELKTNNQFLGVMWGCLNSTRNIIKDRDLRGFLIKKQGFAIGDRRMLRHYFRPVYYDRYIGEIIIVNPKLIPNGARNDFAYSSLRTILYNNIGSSANEFNAFAHSIQEYTLGDEQIDENTIKLKEINNDFSLFSTNANKLVDFLINVREIRSLIQNRLERKSIREERVRDANKLINSAIELEDAIQATINNLTKQSSKVTKKQKDAPTKISRKLSSIKTKPKEIDFNNLLSLLESLDVQIDETMIAIIHIIDERAIQMLSENEKHYIEILKDLRDEFEKLN